MAVIGGGWFCGAVRFRFEAAIWTASAPGWGMIDASLPSSEGQPAPVRTD